jgi:hypothetical protein
MVGFELLILRCQPDTQIQQAKLKGTFMNCSTSFHIYTHLWKAVVTNIYPWLYVHLYVTCSQ